METVLEMLRKADDEGRIYNAAFSVSAISNEGV
jgi:hypothetical protein